MTLRCVTCKHCQRLHNSFLKLKSVHPDVPWRSISGFRNILVHNYLGEIDPVTVTAVIHQHLEPLAHAARAMLENSQSTGG